MLTAHDFQSLAAFMVEKHGANALGFAERAVNELEDQGEKDRAHHWRCLRSLVIDMLAGRLSRRARITIQ